MSGNINSKKRVWLLALILAINVAITTIAVVNVLNDFRLDSSGAIDLVVDASDVVSNEDDKVVASVDDKKNPSKDVDISDDVSVDDVVNDMAYKPGFEASDDDVVWETNTEVNIFKVSYVNGESVVTVKSDNNDKLIAPGTESSYSFKFKNTGNVALDYTLSVEAFITGTDVVIPVDGRIGRYDGKWIAGDGDSFVNVVSLNGVGDKGTLASGRYTYYTLDWKWPFDGDDSLDTYLGNLACEKDLTLTIKLNTVATISDDVGGGIIDTGDSSSSTVWVIVAGLSFVMFLILLFVRRDDEEEE